MSPNERADSGADARIQRLVGSADLAPVAAVLREGRGNILERWLAAARNQPFHTLRPDDAVADSVPPLFDALVAFLERSAPRWIEPGAPLDDATIREAARAHANQRYAQGLGAADIGTEFRLLRHEIGRTLRERLGAATRPSDLIASELLINDALDGATWLALAAWDQNEVDRRRLAAEVVRLAEEREIERRLRDAVLEQVPAGIIIADAASGHVVFHNSEASRIGHPVLDTMDVYAEGPGLAFHLDGTPFPPPDYPIARALRGETVRGEVIRYRRADGSFVDLAISGAPIHDKTGKVVAAVTSFTDVNEAKR